MPTSALTIGFGSSLSSGPRIEAEVLDETVDQGAAVGEVTLDPEVVSVRHAARPELDYLGADLAPAAVIIDGRRHDWHRLDSALDVDEVESRYRLVGRDDLELVVRHSFRTVWVQRYVLSNSSADPLRLDDLEVALAPGTGTVGWVLAAGAEAFWLCQPIDGAGPVLAATLQFGEVNGYRSGSVESGSVESGSGSWRTGPIDLAAGSRYVVQWVADWYPTTADFQRRRASVLPDRTELRWPQPCEIAGVDAAVVADPPLLISQEGEQTILTPPQPGRFEVERRSSRGTSRCALTWVEPVADVLGRAARQLLDGPRTPAGVVRLPDSAAGLVVQCALADRLPDHSEEAAEALDRFAARLLADVDVSDPPGASASSQLSVFDIAVLAGESARTGDRDCATLARAAVLNRTAPEPGLGLAATILSMAELAAGVPIGPILEHLTLLSGPTGSTAEVSSWARLELALIVRPPASELLGDELAQTSALGASVGSGLLGEPMRPSGEPDPAYLAAVLALIPDARSAELHRRWSLQPQALAERQRWRSLSRWSVTDRALREGTNRALREGTNGALPEGTDGALPEGTGETLAWLALGQPTA